MRGLKAAVIIMGVLIIVGVVVLVGAIAQRLGGIGTMSATTAPIVLDEPPGTRIAATAAAGDRLVLTLQGGGADRVIMLDTRTGRIVARAALAH